MRQIVVVDAAAVPDLQSTSLAEAAGEGSMAGLLDRIETAALDLRDALDFDLPDAPDVELPDAPDFSLRDALDIDLVYMAIGASDALGVGASPITNGYVFRIEDALDDRDTNVQLVNVAVPDANLDTIADAAQLALQIPEPDLVTIWVGANDVVNGVEPDGFEAELDNLLDEFDGTGATVAIADLPDLTELPRFIENPDPDVTSSRIEAFNEAIRDQAQAHGAVLVPLSGEEVDDRFVSDADGFHPSDAGHARIAELFLDALEPEVAGVEAPVLPAGDFDLLA
jgi:acyl-CoA thioesterase-1